MTVYLKVDDLADDLADDLVSCWVDCWVDCWDRLKVYLKASYLVVRLVV